jgi:glycosyltransferase involved in cell wall biosynthesis
MRLLLASSSLPFLSRGGGAQRTEWMLKALSEFAEVDCAFITPTALSSDALATLRSHCTVRAIATASDIIGPTPLGSAISAFTHAARYRWRPHAPSVAQLGSLDRYDVIVARYLQSAATFDLFGKRPLVLDVDDYDPDRVRQRLTHASFFKALTLRRALRFSEAAHHTLLPQAHALWVSNPDDRRHSALARAIVLPNLPPTPSLSAHTPPTPPDLTSQIFLMVGTLSYSANLEGARAFIERAWPQVIARFPSAEFHLIGAGLPVALRRRWARVPGVKLVGFVDDLASAYAGCLATIAPILAGGGTNIKVLESAAYARTCILTTVAHRGLGATLPAGEACLLGTRIEDLATRCLELLAAPATARTLGDNARRLVQHHHNFATFAAAVRQGCASALPRIGLA